MARRFVFLAIYLVEFVMKVIARGFALQPYSYLRDGWNWLDFVIIIISCASYSQLSNRSLSSLVSSCLVSTRSYILFRFSL